jgi:hypothetical protein
MTNQGPLDCKGNIIKDGDYLAVGTNQGIRLGRVIAVKTYPVDGGGVVHAITIDKDVQPDGERRIQTFQHKVLGAKKFWVVVPYSGSSDTIEV